MANVDTPFLAAIQSVPGETPGEKFKWLHGQIQECRRPESTEFVEPRQLPRELLPLAKIQSARKLLKNPDLVVEAVKSENKEIVNRAFKAKWFFGASNKKYINTRYFSEHLFPYVSMKTRAKLVKRLALCLQKEPELASEFFNVIACTYGIDQAMPLLTACSGHFIYETVKKHKIILPKRVLKLLLRRKLDVVVKYLKLSKPSEDPYERNLRPIRIHEHVDLLEKLVKRDLVGFTEILEMHEKYPISMTLSNASTRYFLKNGGEYLAEKPKLYLNVLQLKLVEPQRLEGLFPKLLPQNVEEFDTDHMLEYLKHYPEDQKVPLLKKSYREVYKKELLDEANNVTPQLMMLLPAEERIKCARMKMEKTKDKPTDHSTYSKSWRCYLSTEESIPVIKEEISKTSDVMDRAYLVVQMIYTCKVNKNDAALIETLKYLKDRHRNEVSWFQTKVLEHLVELYDLWKLSQDHWTVLDEIIKRLYVKNDLFSDYGTSTKLLEEAIHFRLVSKLPIEELVRILISVKLNSWGSWNILTDYPEYEKQVLDMYVTVIAEKFPKSKQQDPEKRNEVSDAVEKLLSAIYDFNERHSKPSSKVERLSIKSYPWLQETFKFLTDNTDNIAASLKNRLETHENDVFVEWFGPPETVKVNTRAVYLLLKKDPQKILDKWEDYWKQCGLYPSRLVTRFIKNLRWYKDIPMKFAEKCFQQISQKEYQTALYILSVLVHGNTYAKVIEPLLPTESTIDIEGEEARTKYAMLWYIPAGMKEADPPVSFELVSRLCEGEFLPNGLMTLTNICRRVSVAKVIPFAKNLAAQRVSVRKHGVRMVYMVSSLRDSSEFLLSQWRTETHYSVREVLFTKTNDLFVRSPGPTTWQLLKECMSGLSVDDTNCFPTVWFTAPQVPNEYIAEYIFLVMNAIEKLEEKGLPQHLVVDYVRNLLQRLDTAICNLLPEEFTEKLVERYFFSLDTDLAEVAREFVISSYLIPAKEKLDSRMKLLARIFGEAMKSRWNQPHPQNPLFYPVNNAIQCFVGRLISSFPEGKIDPQLIEGTTQALFSVLTPIMEPKSYLLLIYAREHTKTQSRREFGAKLGTLLEELIEIYTPLFLCFMSDTLQSFLRNSYHEEKDISEVIEGLIEMGTKHSCFVAAKLLTSVTSKKYFDAINRLIQRLRDFDYPAVTSTLNDILNDSVYSSSMRFDD